MKYKAAEFSDRSIAMATASARRRIESTLKLAEKLTNDPDSDHRHEHSLCKACHYFTQIGGAAMTEKPCAACGADQMYGSTNTDNLCVPCAKTNNLCKHCGGHMDLGDLSAI